MDRQGLQSKIRPLDTILSFTPTRPHTPNAKDQEDAIPRHRVAPEPKLAFKQTPTEKGASIPQSSGTPVIYPNVPQPLGTPKNEEGDRIKQMIISNYQPRGKPPGTKLGLESGIEEVTAWCQAFRLYIKSGKIKHSINIPYKMIIGYVANWCEIDFFNTTLKAFIDNNRPEEDLRESRMSEDIIVDLIHHYFSSVTPLYDRITAVQRYSQISHP